MGLGKRGGALLVKPGIARLSQLEIDVDKDWQAMGISNIKEVVEGTKKGDLIFSDGTVLCVLSPGPIGMLLMTQGPGTVPAWQEIFGLPTAAMLTTTDITDTEARANAEIVYDIAEDCEARFRWREEGGAWTETAWQNGLRKGDTLYHNMSGLTPGTVHEVQCQARNPGAGEGHWSASETFMTLGAPLAATPTISDVSDTEARINCEITKDEDVDCEGSFRWRTAKPGNVVYNRRKNTPEAYDTAIIDLLEAYGFTVDVVDDGDVAGYDFTDIGLLVVGAPDVDWVANHTAESTIAALSIPVISFCRGTSRNALEIATSSTSSSVSAFTVVDDTHPILVALGWASGSYSVGDSVSTHEISSLHAEATLVMHSGSSGSAGLAERIVDGHPKVHFGYHRFDVASQNAEDLFNALLDYLQVMEYSAWTETPWQNGLRLGNPFHEDLSGLDHDTGHEVQSRARNHYGTGPWSATKAFRTLP